MKPSILVILGSTREGRVGETVARWLMRQLDAWQEGDFELADLRDYRLPIYEGPSSHQRDAAVRRWTDKVAAADGYIIVTPEYNHGYPAALKSALDHAYENGIASPSPSLAMVVTRPLIGRRSKCVRCRSSCRWFLSGSRSASSSPGQLSTRKAM